MDEQRRFLHSLLTRSGRAYATETAGRMADWLDRTEWPYTSVVADTQQRLAVLGAAVAVGVDDLFKMEVDWSRGVYAARGVPEAYLVDNLNAIESVLEAELPDKSASLAVACLRCAIDAFADPLPHSDTLLTDDVPHVQIARRYLLAVLEADRTECLRIVDAAVESGIDSITVLSDILPLVQEETGRMWAAGELNVVEEHVGSRITEEVVVRLTRNVARAAGESGGACAGKVLAASVAGNHHDIGLRIVAAVMRSGGFDVTLLGANTPIDALLQGVHDFGPQLIALSAQLPVHVPGTRDAIASIRKSTAGKLPVMVGGAPFDQVPELWRAIGADGHATTAARSLEEGRRLLSA